MALATTLSRKIGQISERLDRLTGLAPTSRRLARIEKQKTRLDKFQQKLDDVTGDKFDFNIQPLGVLTSVTVDIFDSALDGTFSGGDQLKLRASASGRKTSYGTSSYSSTVTLQTEIAKDQILLCGQSTWNK